jgi:hypothetical protein
VRISHCLRAETFQAFEMGLLEIRAAVVVSADEGQEQVISAKFSEKIDTPTGDLRMKGRRNE